ncbi:unnamed protein product [Lymnaea stagnalis]|uniref:Smr domain-containing protein n=1 Tax=Lymnaea stagnalis TaxID=6523 RepID=A0AAV2I7T8_LYMST
MEHSDLMIIIGVSVGAALLVIVFVCWWCCSTRCQSCRWENDSGGFGYRTQINDDIERQSNVAVTRSSSWSPSTQPSTARGLRADEHQRRAAHQPRRGVLEERHVARQLPQQQTLDEFYKQQLREWQRQQQFRQASAVQDQHWNENEVARGPDSRRNAEKTLDLHNYFLRQAMQAFIKFLKENESIYHKNNCREADRYVYIITGRGLHSKDGVPKIKPAVESYLDKHKYKKSWENAGGMVTVDFLSRKGKRSNQ